MNEGFRQDVTVEEKLERIIVDCQSDMMEMLKKARSDMEVRLKTAQAQMEETLSNVLEEEKMELLKTIISKFF